MADKPYIIILNGPPFSGKDELATSIIKGTSFTKFAKLSTVLKLAIGSMCGLKNMAELEQYKDIPANQFGVDCDLTFRELIISLDEDWARTMLGEDYLAAVMISGIEAQFKTDQTRYLYLIDAGKPNEILRLVEHFGADHTLLLQLERDGATFDRDSRSYVSVEGVEEYRIKNDLTSAFFTEASNIIGTWLLKVGAVQAPTVQ